ncbi:MAG: hypothetical protein ACRCZF_08460 [Gemmataceae bacterium]
MNSYSTLCDDFGTNTYLIGKVELPTSRETVLHFFEAVQKAVPKMTEFEKRDSGEYTLEEDRELGHYRWVTLDGKRLCSGYFNPPTLDDADEHNTRILEMANYHLDISPLQTEAIDVLYYFDFQYQGNHDEVVATALANGTPLEGLTQLDGSRVLHYQPTVMMALDEGCHLQARMNIETRTTAFQVRTGNYSESPISVYFTIRQFWGKQPFKSYVESYHNQRRILDELVQQYLIPNVIQPLQRVIGAKQ